MTSLPLQEVQDIADPPHVQLEEPEAQPAGADGADGAARGTTAAQQDDDEEEMLLLVEEGAYEDGHPGKRRTRRSGPHHRRVLVWTPRLLCASAQSLLRRRSCHSSLGTVATACCRAGRRADSPLAGRQQRPATLAADAQLSQRCCLSPCLPGPPCLPAELDDELLELLEEEPLPGGLQVPQAGAAPAAPAADESEDMLELVIEGEEEDDAAVEAAVLGAGARRARVQCGPGVYARGAHGVPFGGSRTCRWHAPRRVLRKCTFAHVSQPQTWSSQLR